MEEKTCRWCGAPMMCCPYCGWDGYLKTKYGEKGLALVQSLI